MRERSPLLQTHNLVVGYGIATRRTILFEPLKLSLYPGEMICFMGPNGAGKSSLLRTLAGLQKPLEGKVMVRGASDDGHRSRQISVVLTERIAAPQLTVSEVITFGRYPYLKWNLQLTPGDRASVEAAISRVRLESLVDRKIHTLSDGQMQMVMIARALAQDTPIILLDEPTTHLDLNNRLEVMNLLRSLAHDSGKAILLTTHDLDLALQTADKIWLAEPGHRVLTGWPEDLVLDGSFDAIFQMKGFDLKTGKVQHTPFRETVVQLLGEGPSWWWTKNALERHGYSVSRESAEIAITVIQHEGFPKWKLRSGNLETEVSSIEMLIENL